MWIGVRVREEWEELGFRIREVGLLQFVKVVRKTNITVNLRVQLVCGRHNTGILEILDTIANIAEI
jgi:hypothetical protein